MESVTDDVTNGTKRKLTDAEISRIERNREKAKQLKLAKATTFSNKSSNKKDKDTKSVIDSSGKAIINLNGKKFTEHGGGFLIKYSEEEENKDESINFAEPEYMPVQYDCDPANVHECLDCKETFIESNLLKKYNYSVCDTCKNDEDHKLITRTEAKDKYLLKDCDLDKREPILKYQTFKNPHNVRWGDMRLYLELQVKERALEIYESEEKLNEEHESRIVKREKTKLKKFNKNIKQLRMEVRSSLYDRTSKEYHAHVFDDEVYNEEEDNYSHKCKICGLTNTFEKM